MPGTQLTQLGISNTNHPQLRVQTESVNYVNIRSYYHYVHRPLSGIVSYRPGLVKFLEWLVARWATNIKSLVAPNAYR